MRKISLKGDSAHSHATHERRYIGGLGPRAQRECAQYEMNRATIPTTVGPASATLDPRAAFPLLIPLLDHTATTACRGARGARNCKRGAIPLAPARAGLGLREEMFTDAAWERPTPAAAHAAGAMRTVRRLIRRLKAVVVPAEDRRKGTRRG